MNAYVSKEESQLLSPSRISYPAQYAEANKRRAGGLSRVVGLVQAYFARRAALAELRGLSDRELADIGLTRSAIPTAVYGGR